MRSNDQIPDQRAEFEKQAAEFYFERAEGRDEEREKAFQHWLKDPERAEAYERVCQALERTLEIVDRHIGSSTQLDRIRTSVHHSLRRRQKSRVRRRIALRLLGGSIAAGIAIGVGLKAFQTFQSVPEIHYQTHTGEQRIIELEDHSRIAVDAQTELRVRFSADSRTVSLSDGQAQFMVVPDPRRPFRVEVGEVTITAVGTSFNVEYVNSNLGVTMMEGIVGVALQGTEGSRGVNNQGEVLPGGQLRTTNLVGGQALQIDSSGKVTLQNDADVDSAIAWRRGKLVFKSIPLREAVQRVNRYSRLQIALEDPSLAEFLVNGVFDSGDTRGFIEAVKVYMPVKVSMDGPDLIRVTSSE